MPQRVECLAISGATLALASNDTPYNPRPCNDCSELRRQATTAVKRLASQGRKYRRLAYPSRPLA